MVYGSSLRKAGWRVEIGFDASYTHYRPLNHPTPAGSSQNDDGGGDDHDDDAFVEAGAAGEICADAAI